MRKERSIECNNKSNDEISNETKSFNLRPSAKIDFQLFTSEQGNFELLEIFWQCFCKVDSLNWEFCLKMVQKITFSFMKIV